MKFSADELNQAIETVESRPPFQGQHDVVDLWFELQRRIEAWFGQLHFSNPALYWTLMVTMTVVGIALTAHILWSFWVVYRSISSSDDRDVDSERQRGDPSFSLRLAEAALADGRFRPAVEWAWRTACDANRISRSLTPRKQATALAMVGLGNQGARLLRLHERVCFSGDAPTREAAEAALSIAREMVA